MSTASSLLLMFGEVVHLDPLPPELMHVIDIHNNHVVTIDNKKVVIIKPTVHTFNVEDINNNNIVTIDNNQVVTYQP